MIKEKIELENYLETTCVKYAYDRKICGQIYDYANTTYDVPKSIISDLVTGRVALSEISEYLLFILLDSLRNVPIKNDDLTNHKFRTLEFFFTNQEIEFYKKTKYHIDDVSFPLKFRMLQVTNDQWIGTISVKQLMKLRKAQLINYNINAQRTMQKIIRGDKASYKITVNKTAVSQILNSYKKNIFIPNTITLNMPVETFPDFDYDEETCYLNIRSLQHFDITDGYHRYIAMCRIFDMDKDFDYNMEIRIINFTEDKAKQFIFQEDQKTKMSKIASKSMDMNHAANIVATRLNESVRFNLKGLVSRNDGVINFGDFSALINYFYFRGVTKEKENTTIIQATKELTENFNMFTEYNTEYLEKPMSYSTLLAAMFCFDYFKNNPNNTIDICDLIEKTALKIKQSNDRRFSNKMPRKVMMNQVEIYLKGVM